MVGMTKVTAYVAARKITKMIAGNRLGYEETRERSCYLKMMVLGEKSPLLFCVSDPIIEAFLPSKFHLPRIKW